jgi:hypothetical protein
LDASSAVVVEVTTTDSDCVDPKDNIAHLLESL